MVPHDLHAIFVTTIAVLTPGHVYTITEHQHQHHHGIVYETARKDLLSLAENMGLLVKVKQGKRFVFIAPGDLWGRLKRG